MALFIEAHGGRDVISKSERLLLALNQQYQAKKSNARERSAHRESTLDLRALKEELFEEPEILISRNWSAFERKFEMQERELERVQNIVHEENQPNIQPVSPGPQHKIVDNVSMFSSGWLIKI